MIKTIKIEGANGPYQLSGPAGDHLIRIMESTRRPYEWNLIRVARSLLRRGDNVLDVGANIGNHTVAFLQEGCHVDAIEPNGEALTFLKKNSRYYLDRDSVRIHEIGLGDQEAHAAPSQAISGNIGSVQLLRTNNGPIKIKSLDSVAVSRPIRMMKIDVEGDEIAVLRGAKSVLTEDRPVLLLELKTEDARLAALELLKRYKYKLFPINLGESPTYLFWHDPGDLIRILLSTGFSGLAFQKLHHRLSHFIK